MKSLKRSAALAVAAVGITLAAGPAQGAADVTPPVITSNAAAAFVVGSTINASNSTDKYTSAQQLLKWTVSDSSGSICRFDLFQADHYDYFPGDPEEFDYYSTLATTYNQPTPYAGQHVASIDDWDGSEGGEGFATDSWIMRAQDCAGNVGRRDIKVHFEFNVLQEATS